MQSSPRPPSRRVVWGRRERCQETSWAGDNDQDLPNLHVFALSLPGGFIIIPEVGPTHLQRKQRHAAVGTQGLPLRLRAQDSSSVDSIPGRAPRSCCQLLLVCWGEAEQHFWHPGWPVSRGPGRLLLCDLVSHRPFLILQSLISTTKALTASSGHSRRPRASPSPQSIPGLPS